MNKFAKISENKNLFKNLAAVDVLLTNKCNLRCTYCYQQHVKDYAYFTQEGMRQVWDWLRDINDVEGKRIQFFGGEPMLHRDFILDFTRINREEFIKQKGKMTTTIVSNGLLFDDDFLEEYLGVGTTEVNFSIDTVDPNLCDRGLNKYQIKKILDSAETACKYGSTGMVAARLNITPENYTGFKDVFYELYERGMKRFWFHPLTHSLDDGIIHWPKEIWESWRNDIHEIVNSGYEFDHFTVVEGVGVKKHDEFFGVRDIAMDATGDFTSCYVWISLKDEILGNIFNDELNLDKYLNMHNSYQDMINTHPQCADCDKDNLCYQFSSGNKSTDGTLYRPDELCQQVVDIYRETNQLINNQKVRRKLNELVQSYKVEGDIVFKRSLLFLIKFYLDRGDLRNPLTHRKVDPVPFDQIERVLRDHNVSFQQLCDYFEQILEKPLGKSISLDQIISDVCAINNPKGSFKDVYYKLARQLGDFEVKNISENNEDIVYLTMIHILVLSRTEYYHSVAYGGYE